MNTHSDILLGNAPYIGKRRRFFKGRFITLLILFAFFSVFVCSSQNLKFNKISIIDGLSHSVVKDILQDKYHNLWFATGNGVCKYDGKTFKTYLPDNNHPKYYIPDYSINSMYEDKSGNIWISTPKGLAIYYPDQDYFLNLNFSTIAGKNFMQFGSGFAKILIDKDSILYFCGNPFLILDLKKNIFKTYSISDVPSSKAYFKSVLRDIILNDKNELFIICKQHIYKSSKFSDPVKILSEEMNKKLDIEFASLYTF